MKNPFLKALTLCLICICLFSKTSFAGDQFRTKGRVNLQTGLGFGLHYLSTNQIADKDGAGLTGHLRFGADYGVAKIASLGLVIFRNGFATNKDSSEHAENGGFGLYANLNYWNRPRTTWYGTVGFGYSGLFYENLKKSGKASTFGSYALIGLGLRLYFGNHIGIFTQIEATTYQYKKLEYKSGNTTTATNDKWELGVTGAEVKFGVVFAFGKN